MLLDAVVITFEFGSGYGVAQGWSNAAPARGSG
jgi:hypothetical protein